MMDKELLKVKVEAWKVVVETQRHFNDVSMKVRHFGFILIAAFIGAAGFSLRSGYELNIPFTEYALPVASLIVLCSAIMWWFIWFLDSKWYAPFLEGSVKTGSKLEAELNEDIPSLTLSSDIHQKSGDVTFRKTKINSKARTKIFHYGMMGVLVSFGVLLAFFAK